MNRIFHGDLETIVAKALQKSSDKRYQSAIELGADIRRYLSDEPIVARPAGLIYQLRKFARRHRGFVTAAAVVLIVALAGFAASARQALIATRQRNRAQQAEARAQRRFQEVRELAKSFIFDIYDEIEHLPGATSARQSLVTTALDYLDRLAQEAGDDRELQQELAKAYIRVGRVQGDPNDPNLGDTAGALDSFRKAQALLGELVKQAPQDAELQSDVAVTHQKIAGIHIKTGELDVAMQDALLSKNILEQVTTANPDNCAAQRKLISAAAYIADIELYRGNTERALEVLHEALPETLRLTLDQPDEPELIFATSSIYSKLGGIYDELGKTAESLEHYQQGAEYAERLCELDPQNTDYQRNLSGPT